MKFIDFFLSINNKKESINDQKRKKRSIKRREKNLDKKIIIF